MSRDPALFQANAEQLPAREAAFILHGVSKRYGRASGPVVQIADLRLERGQTVALLGRNGSGKSTLTKLLAGVVAPSKGRVECLGEHVVPSRPWPSQVVAYMPQSGGAFNNLTGKETLVLTARLRGLRGRAAREEVDRVVSLLDCVPLLSRPTRSLSGGQLRLLQFAVSLMGDLPILLLDEPTNDLDAQKRELVWGIVEKMKRSAKTVLVVTHVPHEASALFDRVIIMRDGLIVGESDAGSAVHFAESVIHIEAGPYSHQLSEIFRRYSHGETPGRVVAGNLHAVIAGRLVSDLFREIQDLGVPHLRMRSSSVEDIYDTLS